MGLSRDTTFFKRLTGSDSIHFTTELGFQHFGDVLDELLVAYQDNVYKTNFEWIDNVKKIYPSLKEELDELLVTALQNRDVEQMHLASQLMLSTGTTSKVSITLVVESCSIIRNSTSITTSTFWDTTYPT